MPSQTEREALDFWWLVMLAGLFAGGLVAYFLSRRRQSPRTQYVAGTVMGGATAGLFVFLGFVLLGAIDRQAALTGVPGRTVGTGALAGACLGAPAALVVGLVAAALGAAVVFWQRRRANRHD
jgi:hypothetical protein